MSAATGCANRLAPSSHVVLIAREGTSCRCSSNLLFHYTVNIHRASHQMIELQNRSHFHFQGLGFSGVSFFTNEALSVATRVELKLSLELVRVT